MLKFINLTKLTAKTIIGILVAGSFISQAGIKKAVASDGVQGLELRYLDSAFQCSSNGEQANIKVYVYDEDNNLLTTMSKGDTYTSSDIDSVDDLKFRYQFDNITCPSYKYYYEPDITTYSSNNNQLTRYTWNNKYNVATNSILLGIQDPVPNVGGAYNQSSITEMLSGLDSYEELFLVELGTSIIGSVYHDLQDVVLVVDNNPESLVAAQGEDTVVNVGGSNTNVFDWSEAFTADPDGWKVSDGTGDRDDLYRVYYHQPSGKYVKVSVAQKWRWHGNDDESGAYGYSPNIVDSSNQGMGGFSNEDMFLFSLRPDNSVNSNLLTIEFFNDAELTQKATVNNLNFTLTDLDAQPDGNAREKIVVSATGDDGSAVPIEFYKPSGSVIEDEWIDAANGIVLGKHTNLSSASGVTDAQANIAPVLTGDTHKVQIEYLLAPGTGNASSWAMEYNRQMHLSDLAWNGETVKVTPTEAVDIEEIINPDSDTDDENIVDTTPEDSDGNGIPDVDELNPDEDPDGDNITNVNDDDDDGNGILDVDEIGNEDSGGTVDPNGLPDYQNPDDDGDGIPDIVEIGGVLSEEEGGNDGGQPNIDPNNLPDDDNDGIPNHKDVDSDNNGILDQYETYDSTGMITSSNPSDYDRDGDNKPDYLDLDDDNDGIADVFELYDISATPLIPNFSTSDDYEFNDEENSNHGLPYPPNYPNESLTSGVDAPNFDPDSEPNYHNIDSDGDDIYDRYEYQQGSGTREIGRIPNSAFPVDTNGDDEPDYLDDDSDGDGILDFEEFDFVGGTKQPGDAPRNSDYIDSNSQLSYPRYNDSRPDFQDLDSDNNGKLDSEEVTDNQLTISGNSNIPDFQNLDDDDDGIADIIEIGANPDEPTNSDLEIKGYDDEVYDYQEIDSDNDNLSDLAEGISNDNDSSSNLVESVIDSVEDVLSDDKTKTITLSVTDATNNAIESTTTVNLKDSFAEAIIEGSSETDTISIELNGDGTVSVTGTAKKFDYQTPAIGD